MGLFEELKRRNVFRVSVAYVVTAWLLLQVADILLDTFSAPGWVLQVMAGMIALGFLPAVIFSWAFEITPEGVKRESEIDRSGSITHVTAKKLDYTIIALLLAVGGYVFWESRLQTPAIEKPEVARAENLPALALEVVTPTKSDDKSIAVLPFVNLSSDPEQEFFSDGISEELLNVLAQFPDLRVAARTSSFQFKGDNRNISEIAQLLKVNHILEGSVRKSGTRLRITAQLIEAENGYHLWSKTYDRELKDIFAIQDEISAAIGEALKTQLQLGGTKEWAAPRVAEAANTAAYEAYLHGRYLINQRGNLAISEAVRQLEKALRLDPNYAPAHAQLAIAYALLHNHPSSYGDLTNVEINAKAKPHIERAMALSPDLPELWGARALLASTNGEVEQALEFSSRALELNPVYMDALNWRNNAALVNGQYELAERTILHMISTDPLSVIGQMNYSGTYLIHSDPAAARAMADQLITQNSWAGYTAHSNIALAQGDLSSSLGWLLKAYAEDPLDHYSNEAISAAFAELGFHEEAARVSDTTAYLAHLISGHFDTASTALRAAMAQDQDNDYLKAVLITSVYFAGKEKEALELFDVHQLERGDRVQLSGGYGVAPTLRYGFLLRKVGRLEDAKRIISRAEQDLNTKKGLNIANSQTYSMDRAMLSFLAGDQPLALQYMREALARGARFKLGFVDPMYKPLAENPQYQSILADLDAFHATERTRALELICNANPIADSWQPLAQTCTL